MCIYSSFFGRKIFEKKLIYILNIHDTFLLIIWSDTQTQQIGISKGHVKFWIYCY